MSATDASTRPGPAAPLANDAKDSKAEPERDQYRPALAGARSPALAREPSQRAATLGSPSWHRQYLTARRWAGGAERLRSRRYGLFNENVCYGHVLGNPAMFHLHRHVQDACVQVRARLAAAGEGAACVQVCTYVQRETCVNTRLAVYVIYYTRKYILKQVPSAK